ncbi:AraC family transcriptional regulator [Aliidongia dinghuensis]|uniref:AraC family transcriptional regulator n=1 Tax=Aliidongia dinghuensis TaxID=1867774 RepID=A0A8J2Z1J9_9PROT|nr:AraC family transcriptional regulator [Aliidongia dinghuensis]GGF49815.1 AraC family transcriptional regulator [Aliidongia dinghuensis]
MNQTQSFSVENGCLARYLASHYGENASRFLRMGSAERPTLTLYRKRSEASVLRHVSAPAHEDGYLVSVSLLGDRQQPISGGRFTETRIHAADSLSIRDLSERYETCLDGPFDFLFFHMPRSAIDAIAEENGTRKVEGLGCRLGVLDPIAAGLGRALLPALNEPTGANALFVEHVALALATHLAQAYGGLEAPATRWHGGLSRSHERRAKEFLTRHTTDEVSIAAVATECGLSRSYFIRAFRKTTGKTPHKWLLDWRVARAKQLLADREMPIAEIAAECGFADQSHLTRAFRNLIGVPPGAWRRENAF